MISQYSHDVFIGYSRGHAFFRMVAIAAAIARATVVRLRLVAQAIAGIATSELGQGFSVDQV